MLNLAINMMRLATLKKHTLLADLGTWKIGITDIDRACTALIKNFQVINGKVPLTAFQKLSHRIKISIRRLRI